MKGGQGLEKPIKEGEAGIPEPPIIIRTEMTRKGNVRKQGETCMEGCPE